MTIDPKKVRKRLLARRTELAEQVEATAEERKPVEADQATVGRLSRMDAIQAQAMAQATERLRATEMHRIDAALARLDAGEYGLCVACGGEIDEKRLALDPAAPNCIACARAAAH